MGSRALAHDADGGRSRPQPGAGHTARPTPPLRFLHFWDAVHERVSLIAAHAAPSDGQDTDLWFETASLAERPSTLEADLVVCRAAIAPTLEIYERKQPFLLMLDFQYTSLHERRQREKLADEFEELSPLVRPYIVIRVVGIAPGTPSSAISECVSFLRAISPHVCVLASHELIMRDGLSDCGSIAVSLAIAPLMRERAQGRLAKGDLTHSLKLARGASRLVMIEDVTSYDQLEACMAQGVRFVAGHAIMPESDTLAGPVAISRRAILSSIALVD